MDHRRIAIIGGGIAGCALLYNLTRQGCSDAVLLEKGELTSGSTWHAAGNIPLFAHGFQTSRLHRASLELYTSLAGESGSDIGWHRCGSLKLATTRDQLLDNARHAAKARVLGIQVELIGPTEVRSLFPYLSTASVEGAAWTPEDGHVDPSLLTQALAKAARAAGAVIHRHTRVQAVSRRSSGDWEIATTTGRIVAEHLVNAGGLHSREIGKLLGHSIPAIPMERQYLVTDAIPGMEELDRELPVVRDISAPMYVRQERHSLLVGLYDQEPVFWALDGTPGDFDQALLPSDLERVSTSLERSIRRVPVLADVGIKRVLNGPLMRTPDANPLVGPVPGIPGYWLATGFFAGIAQAGGTTEVLAHWMLRGEPGADASTIDPARFGGWADQAHTARMTQAAYFHEFSVIHPHEELQVAGQPRPHLPPTGRRGCISAARRGRLVPLWFACDLRNAADAPAFESPGWREPVARETERVAREWGVMDASGMARFQVHGAHAEALLRHLGLTRYPVRAGRSRTSLMLEPSGELAGIVLVTCLEAGCYYLTASAELEGPLRERLLRHRTALVVRVLDLNEEWGTLLVAGASTSPRLLRLSPDASLSCS